MPFYPFDILMSKKRLKNVRFAFVFGRLADWQTGRPFHPMFGRVAVKKRALAKPHTWTNDAKQ